MDLEIELVPHVGVEVVDGIEVLVDFKQFFIRVTGGESFQRTTGRAFLDIGIVGRDPTFTHNGKVYDTPINWLRTANRFPPAVREKMAQAVQAKLAEMNDVDKSTATAGLTRPINDAPPIELDAIAEKLVNGESASDSEEVASL